MGVGHNFLAKRFLSLVALAPVNNDWSLSPFGDRNYDECFD